MIERAAKYVRRNIRATLRPLSIALALMGRPSFVILESNLVLRLFGVRQL